MSERADRNPKTIKIPGPDYPITIEHNKQRLANFCTGFEARLKDVEFGAGESVLGRGYHHAGYRRLRDASLRHAHSRRQRRARVLVRRRLGSSECGGLAATTVAATGVLGETRRH